MTVLGQLAHRLISTPDFESLLISNSRVSAAATNNCYDSSASSDQQSRLRLNAIWTVDQMKLINSPDSIQS